VWHHEERRQARQDVEPAERDLHDHQQHHEDRQPPRKRRIGRAQDSDRRPGHEAGDDHAHGPMRQVHRLLAASDGREQRAIHEREVTIGEAGTQAGHP
jgi:hypothetical protein